ncbi:MAG: PilZ domain-containing protein [Myxococcota bacterium]
MVGTGASAKQVRLRVGYKSPEALLAELTKSVGRGGVRIESKKSLPVGTGFVFELHSQGVREPVEVCGTVMSVTESAPGRFVLHIRYEPPKSRRGIESVLESIVGAARSDAKRRHPRIPLHVRAVEDRQDSAIFRLRDISKGGLGVDVDGETMPKHVRPGVPFLMRMKLSTGPLVVAGEVVWTQTTKVDAAPLRLGVAFSHLPPENERLLDDLLNLRALPAPPWIARLTFGAEALAQRPF